MRFLIFCLQNKNKTKQPQQTQQQTTDILNLSLQVLLVDLLWNSRLFLMGLGLGLGHWLLPDPLLAAVGLGLAACALDLVASAAAIWGNLL